MLWRHMRQQRFNGAGGSGCNDAKNHEAAGSRGANGLLAIRPGAQRHDENIGRLMRRSPNRSRMPSLEATDPARAHECAGDFVVEAVRRLNGNDVSRAAVGRPAADGGDDLPARSPSRGQLRPRSRHLPRRSALCACEISLCRIASGLRQRKSMTNPGPRASVNACHL